MSESPQLQSVYSGAGSSVQMLSASTKETSSAAVSKYQQPLDLRSRKGKIIPSASPAL
jgi:hypothetical protein